MLTLPSLKSQPAVALYGVTPRWKWDGNLIWFLIPFHLSGTMKITRDSSCPDFELVFRSFRLIRISACVPSDPSISSWIARLSGLFLFPEQLCNHIYAVGNFLIVWAMTSGNWWAIVSNLIHSISFDVDMGTGCHPQCKILDWQSDNSIPPEQHVCLVEAVFVSPDRN
jgi:hypothetical protein